MLNPLSYWVEIIGQNDTEKTKDVKETDTGCYRMVCHTIILASDFFRAIL